MPPKKTTTPIELRADLNIHAHHPPSPPERPEPMKIRTAVSFGDVRVELEIPVLPHDSHTLNHFQNGGPLQRLLDLVIRRESAAAEEKEMANAERKIRLEAERLRIRDSGMGVTQRTTGSEESVDPADTTDSPPRPARARGGHG